MTRLILTLHLGVKTITRELLISFLNDFSHTLCATDRLSYVYVALSQYVLFLRADSTHFFINASNLQRIDK